MKIFLSAVSSQFKDCRNALASDLRATGAEVTVQEDFTQKGHTLLEKLEEYIAGCDRVIALVGDAYGWEPPLESFKQPHPRRSYTQWEYFFARGERLSGSPAAPIPVYVYFANNEYLNQRPADEDEERRRLQSNFIAAIHESDKDRGGFGSLHELRANVLRDGFKLPEEHKPNNLPHRSIGELFKGRDEFLNDLRCRLVGPAGRAAAIVSPRVLHGLGGVGKTRAAIEYGWRFATDYGALLFVSATGRDELRSRLADLVGVLKINTPEIDVESRLREVLRWLDEHPGWLLIIDNADTDEAVNAAQEMLARLSKGHVLITSRVSNWRAGVEPLELGLLAKADAVDFLLKRANNRRQKPDDPAVAATIAQELGRLALALEQAGAYINQKRLSFREYLERWQSKRSEVLKWRDPKSMDYPVSVAVTWLTTFDQLSKPARRLLGALSWFAPDPIPLSIFDAEALSKLAAEPRDALADLTDYSFVRFTDDDAVEVHRLVQEITRNNLAEPERSETLQAALASIVALTPDVNDARAMLDWAPLVPHALTLSAHANAAAIDKPTAELIGRLGNYFGTLGQFSTAEPMLRRALAIRERVLGADHPGVVADLNNLAVLLQQTNRLAEAEPMFRRALEIRERALGPDHLSTATDLNNLAVLLQQTNRTAEAEPLFRRALVISERALGPSHPGIVTDLNNPAVLLQDTNQTAEAEPLFRRALVISERALGPNHPGIADCLDNLAGLLQETNRTPEAEPMFRRALEIRERALGPDHPDVVTSLNNLAMLLQETNRPDQAEPMFRRALVILERAFGDDHPDLATSLDNLAVLLQKTNRPDQAEPMLESGTSERRRKRR